MWRFLIAIILFGIRITFSTPCFSQNKALQKEYTKATDALQSKDYKKAIHILSTIVKSNDKSIKAKLYLADAYHSLGNNLEEIHWLKLAVQEDSTFFPKALQLLGDAYFTEKKFTKAEESYSNYNKIKKGKRNYIDSLKIKSARISQYLIKNPVPFVQLHTAQNINTNDDEYSPSIPLHSNELVFTRQVLSDNYTQEDIYSTVFSDSTYRAANRIKGNINTNENEGAQCISSDGKFLFFTACNRLDGFGSCDLYISQKLSTGAWSEAYNLGNSVNSKHWDSHPSISTDGRKLYFASSRGGELKRSDIFIASRIGFAPNGLPVYGKTEALDNSINTPLNETTPFIHADQKTLYFASDGHPGLGKQDLFSSVLKKDKTWTTPQNLGYPINDSNDNLGFVLSEDGKTGMITRTNNKLGDRDIIPFQFESNQKPNEITILKGLVTNAKNKAPLLSMISCVTLKNNDTLAYATSSLIDGTFITSIARGEEFRLLVESQGFLFHSERVILNPQKDSVVNLQIALDPIEKEKISVLRNLFFETNESIIKKTSYSELDALVAFLQNNRTIKIEIGGHTDSTGSKEFNTTLSIDRAKVVRKYLINKGIDPQRVQSKGYADSKPINTNNSEEGKSENRRTEIKIVHY